MNATIINNLKIAKSAKDVFGDLTGPKEEQLKQLKHVFRMLAKATHEDRFPSAEKNKAKEAFQFLNHWNEIAITEVENGTYGQEKPVVISFRKHTYILIKKIMEGDLAEIYTCREEKGSKTKILKLSKDKSVNLLLKNEAKNLLTISQHDGKQKKLIQNHIQKFENSFEINGRQGNFLELNEGFFSLEQVIEAYPNGISPKNMAWMFRRMLAALIGIHESGHVHGAVTPAHFMINPADHNGRLIDFCYCLKPGEMIKNICPKYKTLYPPEVFEKRPVGPETDIFMAAKTIELLSEESTWPRSIKYFLKSLSIGNQMRRPKNSVDIYQEFGNLLEDLWGPPKWVDFVMPIK